MKPKKKDKPKKVLHTEKTDEALEDALAAIAELVESGFGETD